MLYIIIKKKIEYDEEIFEELENEELTEEKIKEQVNQFIKKEEITLEELKTDKRLIKKLYNTMKLKPTKAKLGECIGLSRTRISKILNDYKENKNEIRSKRRSVPSVPISERKGPSLACGRR